MLLLLAIISALLVFLFGWESYEALATVALSSLAVVLLLIFVLLAISKRGTRVALIALIIATVRDDFISLWRQISGGKK